MKCTLGCKPGLWQCLGNGGEIFSLKLLFSKPRKASGAADFLIENCLLTFICGPFFDNIHIRIDILSICIFVNIN